jgi:hypothetical protein
MALALAWALGLALAWAQGQKPKKPRKNQKKQCFGTIGGAGLVGPKDCFFGFFNGFLVLGDWGLAWLEEAPGASGRPWGREGGRVERTGLA